MNIEKLLDFLPNGLHDSFLHKLSIDYVERSLVMSVDVWTGSDESARETYQMSEIKIHDFVFCIIDKPDNSYPYREKGPLWIDAHPNDRAENKYDLPSYPPDAFAFCLYTSDWNSFFHIAAKDIEFNWTGQPTIGPQRKPNPTRGG